MKLVLYGLKVSLFLGYLPKFRNVTIISLWPRLSGWRSFTDRVIILELLPSSEWALRWGAIAKWSLAVLVGEIKPRPNDPWFSHRPGQPLNKTTSLEGALLVAHWSRDGLSVRN